MADNGITARQKKAITALLEAPSIRQAAQDCAIPERTIYRYLGDPFFMAELRRLEDLQLDAASRDLLAGGETARSVIREIMTNPAIPPGVRLRAAVAWEELSARVRDLRDFGERLAVLEAAKK